MCHSVFTRAKSFNRWITKKDDLFATGRDLLLPELPLKLRLIGLRVTKLKDLKKKEPVTGIKRVSCVYLAQLIVSRRSLMCRSQFFESAGTTGPSSSAKRQRIIHHQMEEPESDELPIAQHSAVDGDEHLVDEDSMPGYHEEEQELEFAGWAMQPHGQDTSNPTKTDDCTAPRNRPRPPNSAPGPSSQPLDVSASSRPAKPHSTITSLNARSDAPGRTRVSVADWQNDLTTASSSTGAHATHLTEDQSDSADMLCPICGDEKFADNMALNAHVDWCLSRGAIRAAQGEARAGNVRAENEDVETDRKVMASTIVKTTKQKGKLDPSRTGGVGAEQKEWWKVGVAKTAKAAKAKGKPGKAKG